jgi:hypothetical protein
MPRRSATPSFAPSADSDAALSAPSDAHSMETEVKLTIDHAG